MRIHLTECPRDAMQGIEHFIPTGDKVAYLQLLLKCGFDVLDFGSFVSPKAVPQMRDTAEVLERLQLTRESPALLAIVANERGATEACRYPEISFLGFPFSVSETFQQRNTGGSIAAAYDRVQAISGLCEKQGKQLRIYLSMGFGNPYGDEWSTDILLAHTRRLADMGVKEFYLSDTTGTSTASQIAGIFPVVCQAFPGAYWGLHLHSRPEQTADKIQAALQAGCRRFDSALKGYGGCPMAGDTLTGNMATEKLLEVLEEQKQPYSIKEEALSEALNFASRIFNH